jgi:hypothetical protein
MLYMWFVNRFADSDSFVHLLVFIETFDIVSFINILIYLLCFEVTGLNWQKKQQQQKTVCQ